MGTNWEERPIDCPSCFDGTLSDGICETCGESIRVRSGIPSVIHRDTGDEFAAELKALASVGDEPLDEVLMQVRDNYMDGSVIDRFFKTRTVNWRVLVAGHLSGRGLVLGDHEEKVGILLSELLDEVYTVDTSLARLRAQAAIANATGTGVKPLHGDVGELPFPPDSFDVVVVQCRASEISEYLSRVKRFIAEDGSVLLLVDGWPRESGLTNVVGLGAPPNGLSDRIHGSMHGHSFGITRQVRNEAFAVNEQYALLSTNRHENERSFHVESQAALDWLLQGSSKTAKAPPFFLARILSKLARKAGILQQCYPRHLFVCQPDAGRQNGRDARYSESILISGKNRSTLFEFDGREIEHIRKVPNSKWQASLNENACAVTEAVGGKVSETVPRGGLLETALGAERHEEPIEGIPLDQTLEPTPESVDHHVGIVFDWLIEFQTANTVTLAEKDPASIEDELSNEAVGLFSPPPVGHSVEIPQVISHGDLFGSNIHLNDRKVNYVIDWEWAEREANPVVDVGFFFLQLADYIGNDFREGFDKLFLDDGRYADRVYNRIEEYCERTGITPYAFSHYLPISYINRIEKDLQFNKRLDINWPDRVQYVWKCHDEIHARLMEIS